MSYSKTPFDVNSWADKGRVLESPAPRNAHAAASGGGVCRTGVTGVTCGRSAGLEGGTYVMARDPGDWRKQSANDQLGTLHPDSACDGATDCRNGSTWTTATRC